MDEAHNKKNNSNRISDEMQKKIINKLEERGAVNPCPKCGGRDFYLSDGYDVISTQKRLDGIVLSGRYLPCALVWKYFFSCNWSIRAYRRRRERLQS